MENSGEESPRHQPGLQNSWQLIAQTLDFGKAVRYNFNRLPRSTGCFHRLKPCFPDCAFNRKRSILFLISFPRPEEDLASWAAPPPLPFRAVGSAMSGFNNVKTWAGTQIKSGLAKAGAWLAKKAWLRLQQNWDCWQLARGAAALIAQAAPGIGTAVGI